MLKIYTAKLLDLYNGTWFEKLNFNVSFYGRKMFLKNSKINPHFDSVSFKKNINYNLLYISYIDDCDKKDLDCMSFGFEQLDFFVREKIYNFFLFCKCAATALLRIPIHTPYNEKYTQKIYADEYFEYYASSLDSISSEKEEYLIGIVYSNYNCLKTFNQKVTNDIRYINNVMENADVFLLKTSRYSGYDYIIYYSDNVYDKISEVCIDIERKLNL